MHLRWGQIKDALVSSTHHEVGVRHEVQADGYVVQPVGRERVVCLEHAVEVVRVPERRGK
jgi:hypothetical protein